jgi:hypothetical protein
LLFIFARTESTRPLKILICVFVLVSLTRNLYAEDDKASNISAVRQFAYEKSGDWLYEALQKIRLPQTRTLSEKQRPFQMTVDWKKQAAENTEKFPLFDVSALDYTDHARTVTAYITGFQTKYYDKGARLFDSYFANSAKSNYLTEKQKKLILKNESLMRDRSMVFYLSYDLKDVQFIYYPGKIRFKGGARSNMTEWLPGTPAEIKNGARTDYALIQDSTGLIGLLNGTFDKIDNFVKWNEKGPMRYGGFGYDFNILMEPQPEMATFAMYENGKLAIRTYQNLKNKIYIRTFIQNRFMVIENGKLANDSNPNAFCSYQDNIARSYLFMDKKGKIGYLWTMYTPASVLASIALDMGVQNMMLLDIHAPVSCSIADPAEPLQYDSYRTYMARSFDLVPNFFRLSPLKASLTWISKALDSRIQTHYSMEAFKGGTEAYFAIFLKDSPESKRVQKQRAKSEK